MRTFYQSFLGITFLLFAGAGAMAQSDSALSKKLDEIVVTGQYQPQSLQKSVYQVRVINNEQIQMTGANNIQQVLNTQLGFRFSNDNTLGISDVQLNGMGGNNVKILVDGVPMIDRYDERVSLSQIDINTIDRIEIVEGPMSVSYGTDAMAGVINIITKKPEKNTLSATASAQEETAGNEYHPFSYKGVHNQNVNVNYAKNHLIASVGGSHNDFDGFGGDQYGRGKTWKPKEQWMGNVRLGYVADKGQIYYRIDGMNENIDVRNPINMNNYKAIDQQYITHRYLHQIQGDYRFNTKLSMTGFTSYTRYQRQTETIRHNFEDQTIAPSQPGDGDLSKLNSFAAKASFLYEINSWVTLQPGIDFNHEKANGARIEGSPQINDYAFFVSAEFRPSDFVKIRPGVRMSFNSQYDAPFAIPSLNTKFQLNKNLDWRLAYGYGFRAPTLRELYLKFFDVNHDLVGNTDLKAEYSNNINTSLTYRLVDNNNFHFYTVLSGFYSSYHNQIDLIESRTSTTEYTYYNVDRAKSIGGRLENHLSWQDLDVTVGFSYNGYSSSLFDDDHYIKEDNRNLLWTPEIMTEAIYKIKSLRSSVGLFYKYYGKRPAFSFGKSGSQDAILLTQTGVYNLADLTVTTHINKFISTRIGLKNLFNVKDVENTTLSISNTEHSNGGPRAIGYGRSFVVGVFLNWTKK